MVKAVRDKAYSDARSMPGLDDSTLTLETNGATTYPARTPNPFAYRRLVLRHQYATLDSLFADWTDSVHRDVRNESYWFGMYDAMESDSALDAPLSGWTHERPTSAAAFLARASYLTSQAWAARGTATSRNTPRSGMARMNELFAEAATCIDTALKLAPHSAEAYMLRLAVARAHGDTALSHRYLMNGLEDLPASFALRRTYLRNIVPRWGGSYPMMQAFVDAAEGMADSNARLRDLRGYIYLDQGEVWELRRNGKEALEAYNYALKFGDEMQFHLERGQMLLRSGRARDALPDLDFAVAASPGSSAAYLWRGMAREALWETDHAKHDLAVSALSDFQRAVVIDPTNDLAVARFMRMHAIAR